MIEVKFADIFKQDVDAIVNPANAYMLHGGGLARVIAEAAGPDLSRESRWKAPIRTGEAIRTTAGDLPFKGVIHVVGPVWDLDPDQADEEGTRTWLKGDAPYWRRNPKEATTPEDLDALLRQAHFSAIRVAWEHGYRSVAFPAVSCGVFRFPVERAAPLAIDAARKGLEVYKISRVVFCLLDPDHYQAFDRALTTPQGVEPTPG